MAAVVPRNSETNGKRCKNGDESLRKSLSLTGHRFRCVIVIPNFPRCYSEKEVTACWEGGVVNTYESGASACGRLSAAAARRSSGPVLPVRPPRPV